jgi:hypothetical protein
VLRKAGSVATRVLPSPVRISAIFPLCKAIPPSSCTSKWRIFRTRLLASRYRGKCFDQKIIQRFAGAGTLPKAICTRAQIRIASAVGFAAQAH